METAKQSSSKQYTSNTSNRNTEFIQFNEDDSFEVKNSLKYHNQIMDLKMVQNEVLKAFNQTSRKRKFDFLQEENDFKLKIIEILNMAKSLFLKRTNTLHNWMYPNASKHIKFGVDNLWEQLTVPEKRCYVSEILAQFGLSKSNLMVNPQIRNIQNFPPLHATKIMINLRNAVSQSSNIPPQSSDRSSSENLCHKRRYGRINRIIEEPTNDFQDDPELKNELETFSRSYNSI